MTLLCEVSKTVFAVTLIEQHATYSFFGSKHFSDAVAPTPSLRTALISFKF